jgi:hypothetical protein
MKLRDKIKQRMAELAEDPASPWEPVPSRMVGRTIRRTWTRETSRTYLELKVWSESTYQAHAFLTQVNATFILGTSAAPWVGRRDQVVPLWLAEAILDEPELALDSHRQNEMRATRRAPGNRPTDVARAREIVDGGRT